MSVYEFIYVYLDWWLFAGFIFAVTMVVDAKSEAGWKPFVIITILPPIYVMILVQEIIRGKS